MARRTQLPLVAVLACLLAATGAAAPVVSTEPIQSLGEGRCC